MVKLRAVILFILSIAIFVVLSFLWSEYSIMVGYGIGEDCIDPKSVTKDLEYLNGTYYACPYGQTIFEFIASEIQGYFTLVEENFEIDFRKYEEDEEFVVFDIGGNIGLFSLYASKRFPKSRIYSFEPVLDNFQNLEKNILVNNADNVVPINKGLSNANEVVSFWFSNWNSGATSSFSFAVLPTDLILCYRRMHVWNRAEYFKYFIYSLPFSGHMGILASLVVSMISMRSLNPLQDGKDVNGTLTTLSDYIQENNIDHIDFMKIDVEGAEYNVMQGIKDEDWKKIKFISMEVHPYFDDQKDGVNLGIKIKNLLESKGFEVHVSTQCQEFGFSTNDMVNLDLVAFRKEKKSEMN